MSAGTSQLRVFDTIEAYYRAVPAARGSGERDWGVWWKDSAGSNWRVSWVKDTGDIYAIRLGPTQVHGTIKIAGMLVTVASSRAGDGPVVLLGNVPTEPEIERVLAGWAEHIYQPRSLDWIVQRLRSAPVEPKPAAHAPLPWETADTRPECGQDVAIIDADGELLCRIDTDTLTLAEREATARLIVELANITAPLREFATAWQGFAQHHNLETYGMRCCDHSRRFLEACRALADKVRP